MIKLDSVTDRIVRHTLVHLMRKVPWGPSRDALEKESARFRSEAGEATREINSIVLNDIFTHNARGGVEDDGIRNARKREEVLRRTSEELHWKSELYALAAGGRFPRADDQIVDNFAESIIDDIRDFQSNGYSGRTIALRDISEAVSSRLQDEGIDLAEVVLPPTIWELIDSGADRPDHIDQDRWDKAVASYYHRMTLDNTPSEYVNGGYDADEYYTDDDFSNTDEDDEIAALYGSEEYNSAPEDTHSITMR